MFELLRDVGAGIVGLFVVAWLVIALLAGIGIDGPLNSYQDGASKVLPSEQQLTGDPCPQPDPRIPGSDAANDYCEILRNTCDGGRESACREFEAYAAQRR